MSAAERQLREEIRRAVTDSFHRLLHNGQCRAEHESTCGTYQRAKTQSAETTKSVLRVLAATAPTPDEPGQVERAAGSLTVADLGSPVSVTADRGYVVEGILVATGSNSHLRQSYVGVGSGPRGRDTRGIWVAHDKPVTVAARTEATRDGALALDQPTDDRQVLPRHQRPHAVFGDDPSGHCGCAECDPRSDCGCRSCQDHQPE